jgi:hypothetical protein
MLPGFQMLAGFIVFLLGLCLPLQKKKKQLKQLWIFLSLPEFLGAFQNRSVAMPCPGESLGPRNFKNATQWTYESGET